MLEIIGKKVVLRDHLAGVHFGTLVAFDVPAKSCELADVRKIWYWQGAGSCHGLAAHGCGSGSNIAPPLPAGVFFNVVEIVQCTEEGGKALEAYPVWRP